MYDSLAIYRRQSGKCIKIANKFFNNETYLVKKKQIKNTDPEIYIYNTTGDECYSNNTTTIYYKTTYQFTNVKKQESVGYDKIHVPDSQMRESCERLLKIDVNFEKITDQLLIQKFFSNYHIVTGIIFVIVGALLLAFAKYKKLTKFVIGIIFGEIFVFTFFVGMIGIHYKHMEWAFFTTGLAIGGFVGYFCLGGSRLFRVILALDCGYIFGLIFFDIFFTHLCTRLSEILLADTLIIFMSLSVVIMCLNHSLHYFYDSIIGSYIFIRGLCCLIKDAGKYAGYRELNLLLYLISKNEIELAKYYYENSWPIYYIYIILMFAAMAASITYYFLKAYKKDDDYVKEKDEDAQKQLLKGQSTAVDEDKDLN